MRALTVDARDARIAGGVMLGAGAMLAFLPGAPGLPCPLRTLTGVPCPLCGMTTSVGATLQLRLDEALAANPAGVFAVAAALAVLVLPVKRLSLPAMVVYPALAAIWIFELYRFSVV